MNIRKQVCGVAVVFALGCPGQLQMFAQGSLTPGGAPAPLFKSLDQIESRIPVSGTTTISAPGSYYLTGNIAVSSGNGITIAANNVRLDLKGFTISSTANPTAGDGIAFSGALTNIFICDGFIYSPVTNNGTTGYGGSGFSSGINFITTQPINARVTDVSVSGCTVSGISLNSNVGNNTGNTVERCLVTDCGASGIAADKVLDSSATVGTGTAIFCSTGGRDRATSYSAIGMDAALNMQDCFGQSTTFYGVNAATVANNCFGVSTGAVGIESMSVNNSFGVTSTGPQGIFAGVNANNCVGSHTGSGGGSGLTANQVAHGCVGLNSSSGSGFGILSGNVMSGCVGIGFTNSQAVFKYNTP